MHDKKHQWREFWKEYHWPVIGVFWVVALGLGYWGFQEQNFLIAANRTAIDNLYLAFMLFTFNPIEGEGVGWALQIARWLAPLVAFCAALQGAVVIFKNEIQDYYVSRLRNHVVICGLGEKGLLLAEKFKEKGYEGVIVLEKDENNPAITDCREKGIFVLIGDATKVTSLKKARMRYARYLIAVCDSDNTNARIAAQAGRLWPDNQENGGALAHRPLCIMHFSDYLRDLLEEQLIGQRAGEKELPFRLEVFNVYDSAARALLRDHSFMASTRPHVLIIGLSLMGKNILERVALRWRARACQECLTVTVFDEKASEIIEKMDEVKAMDVQVKAVDIQAPGLEWKCGQWLASIQYAPRPTVAYICLEDDSATLAAALQLYDLLNKEASDKTQIVMCLHNEDGAKMLLQSLGKSKALKVFGMLSQTCNADLPGLQARELIARAIHDDYREEMAKQKPQEKQRSWEELDDRAKESNHAAADDLPLRLNAIGCAIRPLSFGHQLFQFTESDIKKMAQLEHMRWYSEKTKIGKQSREKRQEIHSKPDYKLWDELKDSQKEKNYVAVRKLPEILAAAGYEIYRLETKPHQK